MENGGPSLDPEKIRKEFLQVLASRRKEPVTLKVSPCKAPLKPVEHAPYEDIPVPRLSPEEAEQLEEERLVLTTEAGEQGRLPVLIIKSKVKNARNSHLKTPAVIILHSSYKCKDYIRPLLEHYAFHGYIAVTIDSRYHGERASSPTAYSEALISAWKTGQEMPFIFDTAWDVMRLMDYLVERDDIDPKRVGMMGISLGGMITLYTVAGDTRFAAAVPIIGVQNFTWAVENNKWQARVGSIPHVFEVAAQDLGKPCCESVIVEAVWKRIAPGLMHKFDVQHILRAVVPRPLLILNGKEDPRCPVEGLEPCIRETAELYAKAGHPDYFEFVAEPGVPHQTTETMLVAARTWFDRFLMPDLVM